MEKGKNTNMVTTIGDKVLGDMVQDYLGDPEGDVTVVGIEHDLRGCRSKHNGFQDVLERAPAGHPVIMLGWMAQRQYAIMPIWHACMAHPNVRFVRLPPDRDEMCAAVTSAHSDARVIDRLALRLYEIGTINAGLSGLKHDLPHAQRAGDAAVEQWAIKARTIYGADLSVEEIVMAVEDATPATLPPRMQGESFPDLCIDLEGTLFREDGTIKERIIELATEREKKGQPITLWTGGDLKEARERVYSVGTGITWKLASKQAFAGARVAEAIDDEREEVLREKYGVEIGLCTLVK